MIEHNFPIDEFRKIIKVLEKNKIDYYVFGGFVFEALNKQKRKHGDLDLIVGYEDRVRLQEILSEEGYDQKKVGRLLDYKKIINEEVRLIDVLLMRTLKDTYKIKGNWMEDILSKKDFNKKNYVKLKNIKFRIMPFEWFALYKDVKHFESSKVDYHTNSIKSILPYCKKMEILKQRKINRIKSDPKYKKN